MPTTISTPPANRAYIENGPGNEPAVSRYDLTQASSKGFSDGSLPRCPYDGSRVYAIGSGGYSYRCNQCAAQFEIVNFLGGVTMRTWPKNSLEIPLRPQT